MKKTADKPFSAARVSARTWLAGCAAAVLIVSISGCSDSDNNAGDGSSTSAASPVSTVTEIPGPTPPTGQPVTVTTSPADTNDPGSNPDPDDNTSCDPADAASIIDSAIGQIDPPVPDGRWVPAENNFSCSGFTYAVLETESGTVSSPYQLAFFYDGVPVGSACNLSYQTVTGADDSEVYVTYRYLVGDEPNADPQGQVDVSYRWNGSGVEQVGQLPTALTQGKC